MVGNSSPNNAAGASLSDLLTAVQNLVKGVNAMTASYINVNGAQNFAGLTEPTVVRTGSGRIVQISIVVAGTTPGMIYDGANLTSQSKPLAAVPNVIGVFEVNLPVNFGILIVPGDGQELSGSLSGPVPGASS